MVSSRDGHEALLIRLVLTCTRTVQPFHQQYAGEDEQHPRIAGLSSIMVRHLERADRGIPNVNQHPTPFAMINSLRYLL